MTRKPVDQAAATRTADPRQSIWDAIRDSHDLITLTGLGRATDVHNRTISSYLTCLEAAGYLTAEQTDTGKGWRLARGAAEIHAPRLRRDGTAVTQGAGTTNMWRTMRMLGEFTPRDIACHSTTDTVTVREETAKSYCGMLLACGYLRVTHKAVPGRRQATYRLIRNSGPRPPQIQRVKQVWDPNTRTVYQQSRGGDA